MNKCLDCGKDCTGKRCKKCFIKSIGKTFDFGRWHFDTQTSLDKAIKEKIQEVPLDKEFYDEFLLSIINELHERVKEKNLKCSLLKIITFRNQVREWEFIRHRFRGGILVTGFFEPINKWHGVTLYPHKKKSIKQKLVLCLRQKWSEQAQKRNPTTTCEKCDDPFPLLHHDNIPFKEIAEQCIPYFTEKEKEEGIGDDWWWHESEADAISNNHPAVIKMLELHNKVKYRWLCRNCHKEEHGGISKI